MAQYWLEITSAADLDQLEVVSAGTLSYTTDAGTPVAQFISAGGYGEYVRVVGVTGADVVVRLLCRFVDSGAVTFCGPAGRISGRAAYLAGGRSTASSSHRLIRTTDASAVNLTSETAGAVTGENWGWRELLCAGSTQEMRVWGAGDGRPETATRTSTNSTITAAGSVGFGVGPNVAATVLVSKIAIGTDGDPAPTGPVGGRQRSRLILTPW